MAFKRRFAWLVAWLLLVFGLVPVSVVNGCAVLLTAAAPSVILSGVLGVVSSSVCPVVVLAVVIGAVVVVLVSVVSLGVVVTGVVVGVALVVGIGVVVESVSVVVEVVNIVVCGLTDSLGVVVNEKGVVLVVGGGNANVVGMVGGGLCVVWPNWVPCPKKTCCLWLFLVKRLALCVIVKSRWVL